MATERTRLLAGYAINIPADKKLKDLAVFETYSTEPLSYDELLPYLDDPWWKNVRRTVLYAFWLTLISIFALACALAAGRVKTCEALGDGSKQTTLLPMPSSSNAILTIVNATVNAMI